jgi:hypothetical protein
MGSGKRRSEEAEATGRGEPEAEAWKHVVAELTLDNRALKDVLSKNF